MISEWLKKALMGVGALAIGLMVLDVIVEESIDGKNDAGMYPVDASMYDGGRSGASFNDNMYRNDGTYYSDQDFDYDDGDYDTAFQADSNAHYGNQRSYEYNTRWGGGSRTSNGSWNHYSNLAGGAVGGTSDGCVYTTVAGGWSNC